MTSELEQQSNGEDDLLDFLVDAHYATPEQAEEVIAYAAENHLELLDAVTESKILGAPADIIRFIAEQSGFEFVSLEGIDINKEASSLLDRDRALHMQAFPYDFQNGALLVAVPIGSIQNMKLKGDLRRTTKAGSVKVVAAVKQEILKTIQSHYRSDSEMSELVSAGQTADAPDQEIPDEVEETSEVVRFVTIALGQAVEDKASDVHFDPQEDQLVLRYRVDGILNTITKVPGSMTEAIVSHIKILANLDISITKTPQDGRLSKVYNGKEIDFRVATLPSQHGEKVVMRILDNSAAQLKLDDLGFSVENLERFRQAATKSFGMLLVTGPTGSGKSTTLYSALNEVNTPEVNIITAEDPVEYTLEGITQVQADSKLKLTFEKILRTVLRADPDIILVGEIRDKETADIAMKAGMTGHMVYSTLHTNDAASALTRLGDMGVEPFITGSTVTGIVSQRLVRRLCVRCREEIEHTEEELKAVGFTYDEERDGPPTFYKAVGCKLCNQGYKGRIAIHEVLIMSDSLEEMILVGAKGPQLHNAAKAEGMIPIIEDGFRKAAKGLTTIKEIMRVVG